MFPCPCVNVPRYPQFLISIFHAPAHEIEVDQQCSDGLSLLRPKAWGGTQRIGITACASALETFDSVGLPKGTIAVGGKSLSTLSSCEERFGEGGHLGEVGGDLVRGGHRMFEHCLCRAIGCSRCMHCFTRCAPAGMTPTITTLPRRCRNVASASC